MHVQIDKNSDQPVYRQIMEQISDKINCGELSPGTQLPTEREMSIMTRISRGTIKRAYDELSSDGIIERLQGRGTFVSQLGDLSRLGRKGEALSIVENMLDDLTKIRLSYKEMESLIGSKIQWRRRYASNVRIAVVDCNMETLSLISEQLCKIPNTDVTELILSNVEKVPQKLTYGYDLIFTTSHHYLRVIELAPTVADRVIKVAIDPTQHAWYRLEQIPDGSSIGIWCMSQQFANSIYSCITRLGKRNLSVAYHLDSESGQLSTFVEGKNVLILPPDYLGSSNSEDVAVVAKFQSEGGLVVYFEYLIDNGSLIHVTHEVKLCWMAKQNKVDRQNA